MKISLFLIFVSAGFCNCKPDMTGDSSKSNSPATKIVNDFFYWYINTAYKDRPGYYQLPPYKKLKRNSYIFDIEEYRKRLAELHFFSEKYKSRLVEKMTACNKEMQRVSWDAEPESQFNIKECDYLWHDNWVGGQGESIDGFEIVNEIQKDILIEVTVQITIASRLFTQAVVTVKKDSGNLYKIHDIQLKWG